MNKKIFALVLPIVFLSLSTNAQVENTSKLSFELSYGIGSSVIQNEGINSRLGTNSVAILGTYQLKRNIGIGTGISVLALNGNSFNENGNFNLTRGILRIPVFLSTTKNLNDKTHFFATSGLFFNHIIEDSYKYVNSTEEFNYENWSLGLLGRLGISYDVYSKASLGIAYNIQYSFNDFSKNPGNIDTRMSTNTFDLFVRFNFGK